MGSLSDDDLLDDWEDLGHPSVEPEPVPIVEPQPVVESGWTVGVFDAEGRQSHTVPARAFLDGLKVSIPRVELRGLRPGTYVSYGIYHDGVLWKREPIDAFIVLDPDDEIRLTISINF